MHVPLREGDFDAFFHEAFVDRRVQCIEYAAALLGVGHPAQQFEVERRGAEGAEAHARLGIRTDIFRLLGHRHQYAAHLVDIRAVGDAYRHADAVLQVRAA